MKIIYVIKRIFRMDYKSMIDTIKRVSNKNNKCILYVVINMIYCGFKYQAGYVDYEYYDMINLTNKERASMMTRGKNNYYVKLLNPKEYWHCFDNKDEFNKLFNKYLGREWLYINENSLNDYLNFIKGKESIIVKPNDESCGKGVRKVNIKRTKKDNEKDFNELINTKTYLIEDVATQNEKVASLHPASVNTIRIFTVISDSGVPNVLSCVIRMGTGNQVVDNFCHGGVTAIVDKETGIITSDAINAEGTMYEVHPTTGVKIKGFKIPEWNKITKLVLDASLVVPEIRLVGWDVCLSKNGPTLIEGNPFPAHDLYKPIYTDDDKIGIVPEMERLIKVK